LQELLANFDRTLIRVVACLVPLSLASCASFSAIGPSSASISKADRVTVAGAPIKVVDLTDQGARQVASAYQLPPLSDTIGDAPPTETVVGPGDVLQVTVWEAPPAVLFGGYTSLGSAGSPSITGTVIQQQSSIPPLTVDESGRIRLPFAGSIQAAGRTPAEIEREVRNRLSAMAHLPQVSVGIVQNSSSTVAVLGAIKTSGRVPITPRGERLLDIIAAAGGVSNPVTKTAIEVQRDSKVGYVSLSNLLRDPVQNVRLGPRDVVTVLYQDFSFTALGAISTSGEIPFESTGITLAQALARVGGLKDTRANARGAFVFRFEKPSAVDPAVAAVSPRTPDGRIPVIYRINLRDPASLFAAQDFPIRDKDVIYVSTAPLSDLQNFVSILSSMAFTAIGLGQALPSLP
jgi:polysaccharide export outer membrane protein